MERRCIVCGDVPTSRYTYPFNMEEALKWQKMLNDHVSAETLRYHCCVCQKHIDNSEVTPHRKQETVFKTSSLGMGNKRFYDDLNKHLIGVSFRESDAIHYFGNNQMDSAAASIASNSSSEATTKQLRKKDGCTQLSRPREPQTGIMPSISNPLWIPSAVFERDFANSVMSFTRSENIENRNTSGLDTATAGGSNLKSKNIQMRKDRIRSDSTCLCGPSCPQLDLRNFRMQQRQQITTHHGRNVADPSQKRPLNQANSSSGNKRLAQQKQQEQGCQCCLTSFGQKKQGPSEIKSTLPSNNYLDLNNKSVQTNQTTPKKVVSGTTDNNKFAQDPINVLVLNGSNVPTYYTSSNNRQSVLSEICVLESDLAHEGAKFLDVDVPKFTICQTEEKESSTEVLLMGKAASEECTCPASDTKRPLNTENKSAPNCDELLKNQGVRMLELENLLTQQQKLQQSIRAKLNELQNTTGFKKQTRQ